MADLTIDEIDLSQQDFWRMPSAERAKAFALLRKERPVAFFKESLLPEMPPGPGYWALTRYDDIRYASRRPDLFISGKGPFIGDMPPDMAEFFGSMIAMDDPRHSRLRSLVNRGFTPRTVKQVEDSARQKARAIIERVAPRGECDFVSDIAAPLPLDIICDMMGIADEHRRKVFELTNVILGYGDPEYVTSVDHLMSAGAQLNEFAIELGEARRARPQEDLTSRLMHAEVEGQRLTIQEFGSFFIMLVVAGNETSRNAISHGMMALTGNPDQREIWMSDFERVAPTAVEEILRFATPVIQFRRTASEDTEIAGREIAAGEKVVLFYESANRDETKFDNPGTFDVLRQPNDHFAFGAGGPHFCLGAHLARREITVMFDELLHSLPDIEITGPPERLLSNFVHGIKRMPCSFTPP